MKIENINGVYIVRGHALGRFFTATGRTIVEAITGLFSEIAIHRSLSAWKK